MLSSLSRWFRGRSRTVGNRGVGRKQMSCKLHLEALEDRCVPTAGWLDPTFGTGGVVTTSFGTNDPLRGDGSFGTQVRDVAVRSDGKVVATGIAGSDFRVVRFNSDGSPDAGFGSAGKVATDFNNNSGDTSWALALVSNKTLVVGQAARSSSSTYTDFALARYNDNGSLDTTFGSGGKVTTSFGNKISSYARAVAVQADGKIVVAGYSVPSSGVQNLVVARYNTNGSLDATFGTGGKVVVASVASASDVAIQADGKIVIAGQDGKVFNVVRFNVNGSLDTSFSGDGIASTTYGDSIGAAYGGTGPGLAIQPLNGKIVLAGSRYLNATRTDAVLLRYNADGNLDASFDGDGIATVDFVNSDGRFYQGGNDLVLQADGKMLVAGATDEGLASGLQNFMVVRVNADGSADGTFGTNGHLETAISASAGDAAYAIALQADGKAVVAGTSPDGFTLARYATAGPQIGSFTANPNPVTSGGNVTLTAANVTDASPGAIITQVAFYRDSHVNQVVAGHEDGILDPSDELLG